MSRSDPRRPAAQRAGSDNEILATRQEPQLILRSFAKRKGWRLDRGRDDDVIARGAEGDRRVHFWTNSPSARCPEFTFVAEHRSGLSFEVRADYAARPLATDFDVETAADGSRRLVPVEAIAPAAQRWLEEHSRDLPSLVPLERDEILTITPQTVALSFNVSIEVDLDRRLQQLVTVAGLLPRKAPHQLPAELRPLAGLIRRWAISDDKRRDARLSEAGRPDLEQLVQAWRDNVELINAVIDADPSSPTSIRLMAFAQAGLEAESALAEGRRLRPRR